MKDIGRTEVSESFQKIKYCICSHNSAWLVRALSAHSNWYIIMIETEITSNIIWMPIWNSWQSFLRLVVAKSFHNEIGWRTPIVLSRVEENKSRKSKISIREWTMKQASNLISNSLNQITRNNTHTPILIVQLPNGTWMQAIKIVQQCHFWRFFGKRNWNW